MTKRNQDFEMWIGDHKLLIFTVEDIASIEGTTVKWKMAKSVSREPVIEKSSNSDLDINNNTFTVQLLPEDTINLDTKSDYYHEAELMDEEGNISTLSIGKVTLHPTLIK